MKKYLLSGLLINLAVNMSHAQTFDWANPIAGTDYDDGKFVQVHSSGDLICMGQFRGTVDFDPSANVSNLTVPTFTTSIYIARYSANGDLIWARSISGTGGVVEGQALTFDAFGNIYMTGRFASATDFDPGAGTTTLTPGGLADIFLLKLNSDGNFMMAKNFPGTPSNSSIGLAIAAGINSDIYITGKYSSTVDFDPGAGTTNQTATGLSDFFIMKTNTSGDLLWVKTIGGTNNDSGTDLAVDASGNVYVSGFFEGSVDFDPTAGTNTIVSNGWGDAFILKMNDFGDVIWVENFGGDNGISSDNCTGIDINSDGNICATGYYYNTTDFNPDDVATENLTNAGSADIFVLVWTTNAAFQWAQKMGGFSDDRPNAIATDSDGNIYTAGHFNANADFNPGVATYEFTSGGSDNSFISKLNSDGTFGWAAHLNGNQSSINSIDVNSNMDVFTTGYYFSTIDFNPGTASSSSTAAGDTDGFIHRLNQCNVNINVSLSGATLTADAAAANYQWLNCNTFSPVAGATSQNFTPASDGDYAVIVTQDVCVDTSTCYTVFGVGLVELNNLQINVYPNPANSHLTIETTAMLNVINIYNSAGKRVQTETKSTFSVENLPAGIYFIQLQTESGISTTRFIKE